MLREPSALMRGKQSWWENASTDAVLATASINTHPPTLWNKAYFAQFLKEQGRKYEARTKAKFDVFMILVIQVILVILI